MFVRLARLRQLSGDIEGAAKNWLEAAAAIPGSVDDDALLACAYCLAAMGEWDRAAAALEPLTAKMPRALFLDTGIKAIKTGDLSALAALAENPQYSQMKTEIYFLLWKLSQSGAGEIWRLRLLTEFPLSPEGRLAAGNNAGAIIVKPNPFWLFLGGLDSLPLLEPENKSAPSLIVETRPPIAPAAPAPVAPAATTITPAAASSVPAAPAPAVAASQPAPADGVKLQTGVFSRQANAQSQASSLQQAGFSPLVEQRIVNNNEMWAVIIIAGSDTNGMIRDLKNAGFDSFPLR